MHFLYLVRVSKSSRLPHKTRILYAELVTILAALQWLKDIPYFLTVILSDSVSALQSLEVDGGVPLVEEMK